MIRPNVEHLFPQYTEDLEAKFMSLYADVKRLVTTGRGFLVDPIDRCLALEWWIGDRRATDREVIDDWHAIKERAVKMTDIEMRHWTAKMQAPLTSVRLKSDYVDTMTIRKLRANFAYVEAHLIHGLSDAPADAQLGVMSLAWAVGAGFDLTDPPRTEFVEAFNAGDWLRAAAHARLREAGNAGVIERNRRQDLCFQNAATVTARGLDPAALWWPNVCPKEDTLHTLAVKAVALGIAHDSVLAGPPDDDEKA
jgi:hypothetical protein